MTVNYPSRAYARVETLESRRLSVPTAPLADALAERALLALALSAARPSS